VVKTILRWLRGLLGYPMPPEPHQIGERFVTMREARDCHVAAIATACGVTYEQAHKACKHHNLPFFLESPIYSNPLALIAAIERLGCRVENLKISELLHGGMPAGKVVCLVHNPTNAIAATLQSHWVVYMGTSDGGEYLFHWGKSQVLEALTRKELIDMLTAGWPNAVFRVESES
jgi:hypothetical protein